MTWDGIKRVGELFGDPRRLQQRAFAARLAANPTLGERVLRDALIEKLPRELVRFQWNLGPYTVDVFFPSCRTVLELDGGIHERTYNQGKDIARDDYLMREHHVSILRVDTKQAELDPIALAEDVIGLLQLRDPEALIRYRRKLARKRRS